jgi:hypothetical protein
MSKPRQLRSRVDFNSPPSRLPQERLAQAASQTTQSIVVVDVKKKPLRMPQERFSRGGGCLAIPLFSNTRVLNANCRTASCATISDSGRVTYGDASGALTLTALR